MLVPALLLITAGLFSQNGFVCAGHLSAGGLLVLVRIFRDCNKASQFLRAKPTHV
jgi:hypothetical protein